MKKIVTFGEIMLRISPEDGYRFFGTDRARLCFGGSEANVAALCSQLGVSSSFVTRVPANPLGEAAKRSLSAVGTDVSSVVYGGDRLGVYYYEKGAGIRPAQCVYDRKDSSFTCSSYEDYDVDGMFSHADHFHLSGITPALSDKMPDICERLCREAKTRGLTVSYDLNHRTKLWTAAENKAVTERLLPFVDLFISNMYQANEVLKLGVDTSSEERACIAVCREIMKRYGTKTVALTVRKTFSADKNGFFGMIYDGENAWFSRKYETGIIDRVGSGDAFDGALISCILKGYDLKTAVEYGASAAALKHSIEGDVAYLTEEEIKNAANGGDGRVSR